MIFVSETSLYNDDDDDDNDDDDDDNDDDDDDDDDDDGSHISTEPTNIIMPCVTFIHLFSFRISVTLIFTKVLYM